MAKSKKVETKPEEPVTVPDTEVNHIEEITKSEEWEEFYKNLHTNPPSLCKDYCSKTYDHKSRESYQY